jgi:hypothetical protein
VAAPAVVPVYLGHDRVVAVARGVGLRDDEQLTLEAVDHRRTQLWALAAVTCFGISAILLLTRTKDDSASTLATAALSSDARLQGLLVALLVGTLAYVADRERRLRILTRLLVEERAINSALSERLDEAKVLLGVAKAMNSRLPLDTVLTRLVEAAATLLRGQHGEVLLSDDEHASLRVVAACGAGPKVGDEVSYDASAPGHVARNWERIVRRGGDGSEPSVHVPVLHANQLLGVMSIAGAPGQTFGDWEQRVAELFAEQAAFVISAIHRAESARWEEAERAASTLDRTGRVIAAAGALKDPLASLIAVGMMLQRERLTEDERIELASVVTRQSKRMAKSLEEILTVQVELQS